MLYVMAFCCDQAVWGVVVRVCMVYRARWCRMCPYRVVLSICAQQGCCTTLGGCTCVCACRGMCCHGARTTSRYMRHAHRHTFWWFASLAKRKCIRVALQLWIVIAWTCTAMECLVKTMSDADIVLPYVYFVPGVTSLFVRNLGPLPKENDLNFIPCCLL